MQINAKKDDRVTKMLAEAHEGLKVYQDELKNDLTEKLLVKFSNETQ